MRDIHSLCFSDDNLKLAFGDQIGQIKVYDLRYPVPLLKMRHQYRLPIIELKFHQDYLVSSDKKIFKFFNK